MSSPLSTGLSQPTSGRGGITRRGPTPLADYPVTWNPAFFMSDTVALCTVPSAAVNDVWCCSAEANASELNHSIELSGVYRAEVFLHERPWIYSNPVYIRS